MMALIIDRISKTFQDFVVAEINDYFNYSLADFVPFCSKLYYFSNFKDFNTLTQA